MFWGARPSKHFAKSSAADSLSTCPGRWRSLYTLTFSGEAVAELMSFVVIWNGRIVNRSYDTEIMSTRMTADIVVEVVRAARWCENWAPCSGVRKWDRQDQKKAHPCKLLGPISGPLSST